MRFSIIIPTFNRPADLERCLAALTCQKYPREQFEVIVVDDGGHVDLQPVVAGFGQQIRLTLLRQTNGGCASARNRGAEHASGDWLAFTDDDCAAAPEWLGAMDSVAARVPDALIGGCVLNGFPDNANSAASQAISDYFDAHMNRDPERGRFCSSNNFAIAASSFQKVGGFDVSFTRAAAEDRDFCDRCLAAGMRIVTVPDAVVCHYREMSLRGFCQHYFHYGQGAFVLAHARARRNAGPVSFEGWGFHLGLLIAPIRKSLRLRSFYLSLLVIVEQFAYAMGYAYEARTHRDLHTPQSW